MHCKCIFRAYSHDYIIEDDRSFRIDSDLYDLLVGNSEFFCILRCHVYVSLCHYEALVKSDLSAWSFEDYRSTSFKVSALSYGSYLTKGEAVCKRYFDLALGACRSEDDDVCKSPLRSYDADSLFRDELSGLRKISYICEGPSFSEKPLNVLVGEMHVTCGYFY